jgi:hypothetical protein
VSIFTILWIGWGVLFLVIEGIALKRTAPGDTLSETIWRWAGVRGYKVNKLIHVRRIILALFMVELTIHFSSGRWWV